MTDTGSLSRGLVTDSQLDEKSRRKALKSIKGSGD